MTSRRGFAVSAYFIIMMALLVWVTGKFFMTVSRLGKVGIDDTVFNRLRNNAERGMLEAEAWLRRMFERAETPRASGWGDTALERIEAALLTGAKFDKQDELSSVGISVYIADTSYDITMFPNSFPQYAIPVIAHKLPGIDEGSGDQDGYFFYYIRSRAENDTLRTMPTFEEVVRVTVENGTGRYKDMRKIFRRYSTGARRSGS